MNNFAKIILLLAGMLTAGFCLYVLSGTNPLIFLIGCFVIAALGLAFILPVGKKKAWRSDMALKKDEQ